MSKEHLNPPQFELYAFDVDGTLVAGKKPVDEIVASLHRLMKIKRVALISGSSYQALETKIVSKLSQTESEFDVYASGGMVRLTYKNGERVYDSDHASDVLIVKEDIEAVRKIVQAAARDIFNWGESVEDVFEFMNYFRDWARESSEGYVWSHVNKWEIKITSPGEKDPNSAIRVEARQDPMGSRVVGLCIKSIPRQLEGRPTKFVGRLVDRLREGLNHKYQILSAGFASIDVNMGSGSKIRAIEHISSNWGISPEQILYFGDEFGEHGNDEAVIKAGVSNTIDVSKFQDGICGPELTTKLIKNLLTYER